MNYNDVVFETSYGTASQLKASDMPEIVFSGKSNVGKSTLINKLFNRKALARVSSVPGKTTTVNFFRCGNIRFADLPGYGYAKRSDSEIKRWATLMETFFGSERDIRLAVQLIDSRHKPSADDMQMLSFLTEREIPFIVALTKIDKLNKTELAERREKRAAELMLPDSVRVIEFSSITGAGVDEIKGCIEQAAETGEDC